MGMTAEAVLSDIGRAVDELKLGLARLEMDEVELVVTRGRRRVRITVRVEDYGQLSGDLLRSIFAPQEEDKPQKCGCGHPAHPGLVCGWPWLMDGQRMACECEA
jgi:hypothetical protein